MKAADFLTLLENHGFDFFTGVPCSYFTPLIDILAQKDPAYQLPAPREDIAVGLAVGAYLAGKKPVIYMQNSGLGYSLEAFASLHLIYDIPTLVLVSYRGPEDQGMEEHLIMGKHTEELLSTFDMQYSIFKGELAEKDVLTMEDYMNKNNLPYFLLVMKGALE